VETALKEDTPADALCRVDTLAHSDRPMKVVAADRTPWCVLRDGDQWMAIEASCPHRGRDMSVCGVLEDGVLTCLGHLWQWNLRDGGSPLGMAERPLRVVRLVRHGDALHFPR
jgi:nitrite reductase/ring-hydroxylating ferredoxin subunit